jgi:hypothetical protein
MEILLNYQQPVFIIRFLRDIFMYLNNGIKTIKSLGNDLLSQAVTHQVPSALTGLTSGFGMWPGVPLSLQSPRDSIAKLSYQPNNDFFPRWRKVSSSPYHVIKPSAISTAKLNALLRLHMLPIKAGSLPAALLP